MKGWSKIKNYYKTRKNLSGDSSLFHASLRSKWNYIDHKEQHREASIKAEKAIVEIKVAKNVTSTLLF